MLNVNDGTNRWCNAMWKVKTLVRSICGAVFWCWYIIMLHLNKFMLHFVCWLLMMFFNFSLVICDCVRIWRANGRSRKTVTKSRQKLSLFFFQIDSGLTFYSGLINEYYYIIKNKYRISTIVFYSVFMFLCFELFNDEVIYIFKKVICFLFRYLRFVYKYILVTVWE